MAIKSRVKDDCFYICFSFGRSNAGLEFTMDKEFHAYTCADFGDGMKFSQNELPASPFICQVGAVKRDECWNRPVCIADLVVSMYKNEEFKLYHGFLKEHGAGSIPHPLSQPPLCQRSHLSSQYNRHTE